jgi:hypothetical protein
MPPQTPGTRAKGKARAETSEMAEATEASSRQQTRGRAETSELAELVSVQQALLREAVASRRVLENYSGLLVQLLERLVDAEERRDGIGATVDNDGAASEVGATEGGLAENLTEESGKGEEGESVERGQDEEKAEEEGGEMEE